MKVQCYFEGEGISPNKMIPYDLSPAEAAQKFCDHHADGEERQHVCVVPLDEEAKALPGWQADDEEPAFKLFVVTPTTTWAAREVDTFNISSASEPAPPPESR